MRRRQIWMMRQAETDKFKNVKPAAPGVNECPNCGRVFKKGLHLHMRHCHVAKLQ